MPLRSKFFECCRAVCHEFSPPEALNAGTSSHIGARPLFFWTCSSTEYFQRNSVQVGAIRGIRLRGGRNNCGKRLRGGTLSSYRSGDLNLLDQEMGIFP